MAVNKVEKNLVVAYKARFGKMELEMLKFERFLTIDMALPGPLWPI